MVLHKVKSILIYTKQKLSNMLIITILCDQRHLIHFSDVNLLFQKRFISHESIIIFFLKFWFEIEIHVTYMCFLLFENKDFNFIYLFAVTPLLVKAKYIHSYKISERKQADKCITTCTLVLLKFRLELWLMWTYFHNSNECFIKSQTDGKSSNWGFNNMVY